jgi:hypothetical protein
VHFYCSCFRFSVPRKDLTSLHFVLVHFTHSHPLHTPQAVDSNSDSDSVSLAFPDFHFRKEKSKDTSTSNIVLLCGLPSFLHNILQGGSWPGYVLIRESSKQLYYSPGLNFALTFRITCHFFKSCLRPNC